MGKHFEWRAAKRLFNLRQEIIERNRCHVALQPGQLSRPCRRQQILSCREHLAKLYEGRSELLECEPRALLHFKMRDFGGFPQCNTCPAGSSSVAMPARRTRSPSPCRTKTM